MKQRQGYYRVDHKNSPGLGPKGSLLGPGTVFEAPVLRCGHCPKQLILNPQRKRSREYCPKCDKYICDNCNLIRILSGFACVPFPALMERLLKRLGA